MSLDPKEVENLVQRFRLNAPRVRAEDVESAITNETYTVLPAGRATICELTLYDGMIVHGKSVTVSAENFNAELGNKAARARAFDAAWEYLGQMLHRHLYERAVTQINAKSREPVHPHVQD